MLTQDTLDIFASPALSAAFWLLIAVVLRPERGEGTFALGVGLATLAGALFVLGYLAYGWLTMGQVLSLPMILFGGLLLLLAHRRKPAGSVSA
mgnify:CR=1 FL=1